MISPAVAELGRTDRSYSQRIQKFPMLSGEDEQTLVRRWRNNRDPAAARQLVASHLRLVAGIARRLQGYGMPLADLIGEGNIGLMKALVRFDPEHGSRFAAYAIWWTRAAMHEYVLRNWSLVKVGSTASQKSRSSTYETWRHG